jgi:hypothetical protein
MLVYLWIVLGMFMTVVPIKDRALTHRQIPLSHVWLLKINMIVIGVLRLSMKLGFRAFGGPADRL